LYLSSLVCCKKKKKKKKRNLNRYGHTDSPTASYLGISKIVVKGATVDTEIQELRPDNHTIKTSFKRPKVPTITNSHQQSKGDQMKIDYQGIILDHSKEQEHFDTSEHGFTAIVIFKELSLYPRVVIYNNCTEIHHKHSIRKDSVELGSDIHGAGINISLNQIDEIRVINATKKELDF